VTVTTIVDSGPEKKLKEEVGPVVVLLGAVDVELAKKAPVSATSAATLVTKVVISGPEDVVAAVIFELAVALLFERKAPGELAVTVLFGEKWILRVVELKRLAVVNDWKGPFREKLGVVKLTLPNAARPGHVDTVPSGLLIRKRQFSPAFPRTSYSQPFRKSPWSPQPVVSP
jgi:hypothetical protein